MTKDEALKLSLEALDKYGFAPCDKEEDWQGFKRAITAIKEALAQPEQELVATVDNNSQKWAEMDGAIAFHLIERHADGWNDIRKMMEEWLSANTPQRTWVGLTDEERKNIMIECESTGDWAWELKAAQAIEAKLKEKNSA